MTNIAVTGGENSKESSVHFFFNLWLSVPIYCHNFTHRVCVRARLLSRDCQSHKNPDNQSLDHELMRARACCLHSLSVLFPLSHPDSRHPLSQQNTGWLLFCCQPLLSDQLNFMYFEKGRGGKRQS